MDIEKLEKFLAENNQPKFRLRQILKAVYQDGVSSFGEITTIPRDLREKFQKTFDVHNRHQMSSGEFLSFEVEKVLESRDGTSTKALLRLADNNFVETVLLWPARKADACEAGKSVCVSTQVGCPMNCGFCATGKGGFRRNLTAEEITDQVLFWKQYLKNNLKFKISNLKLTNVVYMGMGEPFLNWEAVKESLKVLTDKSLFGFGSRSISVSTVGIPEGIVKFAKDFPQMNLAISLHFADDKKRSQYMPVNKKYNLEEIKKALQEYFTITRRKVFIEYIMLGGINDSREDAEKLMEFARGIRGGKGEKGERGGRGGEGWIGNGEVRGIGEVKGTGLLHVNLIRYNTVNKEQGTENNLVPSSKNKTQEFKNYLLQNNINTTIRKSFGGEIQGACGQLAGQQPVISN